MLIKFAGQEVESGEIGEIKLVAIPVVGEFDAWAVELHINYVSDPVWEEFKDKRAAIARLHEILGMILEEGE